MTPEMIRAAHERMLADHDAWLRGDPVAPIDDDPREWLALQLLEATR